jgi:hypothetical protein
VPAETRRFLDEFDVVKKARKIEESQTSQSTVLDLLDEGFQEDLELRKELRQNASDMISGLWSCWRLDCGKYTSENLAFIWLEWAETLPPFRLIDELEAAAREFQECVVGCKEKPMKVFSILKLVLELRYDILLRLREVLHSCLSEGCATSLVKAFSVSLKIHIRTRIMTKFSLVIDPIIPILSIIAYLICAVSCVAVFVFGLVKRLIKVQPSTSVIFFLIFGLLLMRVGIWSAVINSVFADRKNFVTEHLGFQEARLLYFGIFVQICLISSLFVFLLNWISAMESLEKWSERTTKVVRVVAIGCWGGITIAAIVVFSISMWLYYSQDIRDVNKEVALFFAGPAYFAFAVVMLVLVVILLTFTWTGLKSLKKNSSKIDDGLAFQSLYQMIIVFVVVGLAVMLMCVTALVTVGFSGSFAPVVADTQANTIYLSPVPAWFRELLGKIVPEVIISLSLLYYVAQAWVSAAKMQSSQKGSNFVEMNEPLILKEEEQGKVPSAYDV